MRIALLNGVFSIGNGVHTYCWHLKRCLQSVGHTVDVFHFYSYTGNDDTETQSKLLDRGNPLVGYDVVHIITMHFPKKIRSCEEYSEYYDAYVGRAIVSIHNPHNEVRFKECQWINSRNVPVAVVRKELLGSPVLKLIHTRKEYTPHPFSIEGVKRTSGVRVVSTSRVTSCKNTIMILQADCGVEIWSHLVDSWYDMEIKRQFGCSIKKMGVYKGGFNSCSINDLNMVYGGACALVDMTQFRYGDGGGTQYTFLEAMSYGLHVGIHAGWGNAGEIIPYCVKLSNADEISEFVESSMQERPSIDRYSDVLREHSFERVAPIMESLYFSVKHGDRTSFSRMKRNRYEASIQRPD